MSYNIRLYCRINGHEGEDRDPTGGDPFMGGPVAITVCKWCGDQLPASETAQEFNAEVSRRRDQVAADERARHTLAPSRWWHRAERCSCGWKAVGWERDTPHAQHADARAHQKAWSR